MTLLEQVEGEGGSERLSPRNLVSELTRASRRLSKGSGLRFAMRACAIEFVSMCWGFDL